MTDEETRQAREARRHHHHHGTKPPPSPGDTTMATRTKKCPLDGLPDGGIEALVRYAKEHGRTWKDDLNLAWQKAAEPGVLQQIRNSLGPRWLVRFDLAKATDRAIDLAFNVSAFGVTIDIMKIPAIFVESRKAIEDGATVDAAVKAAVQRYQIQVTR